MMKIIPNLNIRNVAGEHIVMRIGADGTDMTTVIALNESSLLLCERLRGRAFGIDDAVNVLLEEYDVDEATARHDVENWVHEMRRNALLSDA